jgi:hypothetical protein
MRCSRWWMVCHHSINTSDVRVRLMRTTLILVSLLALPLTPVPALARELGHYFPGVANIRDFAMPAAPGLYYQQYNVWYAADRYNGKDGNRVSSLPIGPVGVEIDPDIDVITIAPTVTWAREARLLGADYAFYIQPTITNRSLAADLSLLNLTGETGSDEWGLGDIHVTPLWLGWSGSSYDLALHLGFWAPTGDFNEDATDNLGLGFWTLQSRVAGYYYFDKLKASALMLALTREAHASQDDTDITVGDHLALDYGFSQFLSQRIEVGISGYSQWQVDNDTGDNTTDAKMQVHAIGVQAGYWLTPRLNLTAKYLYEYESDSRTQGNLMTLTLTYAPLDVF